MRAFVRHATTSPANRPETGPAVVRPAEPVVCCGDTVEVPKGHWGVLYARGRSFHVFSEGTHRVTEDHLPEALRRDQFAAPRLYFVRRTPFSARWLLDDDIVSTDPRIDGAGVRAEGRLVARVQDPERVVATLGSVLDCRTLPDAVDHLREIIVDRFPRALSVLFSQPGAASDAEAKRVTKYLNQQLRADLQGYGLELVSLIVQKLTIPGDWLEQAQQIAASQPTKPPVKPKPSFGTLRSALTAMSTDPRFRSGSLTLEEVTTVAICRACKKPTTVDARFCPRCGAPCDVQKSDGSREPRAAGGSTKPGKTGRKS